MSLLIHNLLPEPYKTKLIDFVKSREIDWHWTGKGMVSYVSSEKVFHLGHNIYDSSAGITSKYYDIFSPIISFALAKTNIQMKQIVRAKANMTFRLAHEESWIDETIHKDNQDDGHITILYYTDNADGNTRLYNDDKSEVVREITPAENTAIIFPSNQWHRASLPKVSSRRIIVNIVLKVQSTDIAMSNYDYASERKITQFLASIGANKKQHKDSKLLDHLMRCYYAGYELTKSQTMAFICGLHSVYGTSTYKNGCIPLSSDLVNVTFGDVVDKYVRMFALCDRGKLVNNVCDIHQDDYYVLRCLETVNLYDQKTLKNYPELYKFAKDNSPYFAENIGKIFNEQISY